MNTTNCGIAHIYTWGFGLIVFNELVYCVTIYLRVMNECRSFTAVPMCWCIVVVSRFRSFECNKLKVSYSCGDILYWRLQEGSLLGQGVTMNNVSAF